MDVRSCGDRRKQYRATPGEFIDVERLPAEVGEQVTLNQVLMIVDDEQVTVGQPTVTGAHVVATVILQRKARKVIFFHYAPKKRERKRSAIGSTSPGCGSKRSRLEQGETEMAHKKGGGLSRNGRDSVGQRLGVKRFGGEHVISGNIIVRQHGTKFHPGLNVDLGRDYTLFATAEGFVKFESKHGRPVVSVYPEA